MQDNHILILLVLAWLHTASPASMPSSNSMNNNNNLIKCEYRQTVDGDSLVLNCSLLSGSLTSQLNELNGMSFISNGNVGTTDSSTQLTDSIRFGASRQWRTPWESLNINHNIIRSLIWRHSRLSELGEHAFKDLNYIQILDLSYNKLQQLNGYSFKNFELDLIELDVSHNLFQTVPIDLFLNRRLQKLEHLRMNDNPIVYLSRKPFELIRSSIKSIEFNYCQIRSIDLNTFDDMKQLEHVSLIGNHLRQLNEYTFRDLALRTFYVHENPLVCDCHMRWLINYIKNVDYQQQASYEVVSSTSYAAAAAAANTLKLSVSEAAQQLLKCDQPNSLKAKQHFLDINPDSFMCDVEIAFRDELNENEFEMGEDALLICDVYGDPEPVVYWSFGNRPIEKALINDADKYYVHEIRSQSAFSSSFKNSLNAGPSSQSTNKTSELRVKNLQSSDFGLYTCTAEIAGSNNRKQIGFHLKQSGTRGTGGLVVGGVSMLAAATSSLFNKSLSNWTMLLLLAIVVSLVIFILMLSSFICWKCRKQKMAVKQYEQHTLQRKKEQEKLLNHDTLNERKLKQQQQQLMQLGHDEAIYASNNKYIDHLDSLNQNQLSNDSSATLISNNKMSNSIRMAYPNVLVNGHLMNDIYANHSLLTTTSTTTASYLANNNNQQQQQHTIAIDTSNHTPRLHLLNQQQQQQHTGLDSYYDDLRYNDLAQLQLAHQSSYSSPYKQSGNINTVAGTVNTATYSPLIRRDDPTIPLYATLKPKLQHQRQYVSNYATTGNPNNSNNYAPYSTIHRTTLTNNNHNNHNNNNNSASSNSTPPLPVPRRYNYQNNYQVLPPPPPPPPPTKPKRTFEYGAASSNLHSESGAFLLANNEMDCESNHHNDMLNDQAYHMYKHKSKKHQHKMQQQQEGSATSLDEEDLDLNDLKDFEDVTFDNLRKPDQLIRVKRPSIANNTVALSATASSSKRDVLSNENTNNSEQSLLLKSSESSSENAINQAASNSGLANDAGSSKQLNDPNSNNTQTTTMDASSNNTDLNTDEIPESKIYEETEI